MFVLSSLIGTRVGELLALKKSDYSNGELDINSSLVHGEIKDVKNDYSERKLVLTECAKKILDDYIEYSKELRNKLINGDANDERLFFNPKKCTPWQNSDQAYKFSKRVFDQLGFGDEFRGLKPTRHTCVTESKRSKTSDEKLRAYFGHRSIQTTCKHYIEWGSIVRDAPRLDVYLPSMGWKWT